MFANLACRKKNTALTNEANKPSAATRSRLSNPKKPLCSTQKTRNGRDPTQPTMVEKAYEMLTFARNRLSPSRWFVIAAAPPGCAYKCALLKRVTVPREELVIRANVIQPGPLFDVDGAGIKIVYFGALHCQQKG